MKTERELIAVALALIGKASRLSIPEGRLCRAVRLRPNRMLVSRVRRAIRAGLDPLGDTFAAIRSPKIRRLRGATYTPNRIVHSMVRWAVATRRSPARIVDPGAGSGRFIIAAAKSFPKARLIAVEMDPLASLILRANITALGLRRRTTILVRDYRSVRLLPIAGTTLFLGNPPYVRHHDIDGEWKEWLARSANKLGLKASRLAGLHVYFIVKTMQLAKAGDFGAFITSAEWLDVNYGATVRRLLANGMGGVSLHVLNPHSMPFEDALTTGAIMCFQVGRTSDSMLVRSVDDISSLGALSAGKRVAWATLQTSARWSTIVRPGPGVPKGFMELGEICRVHRGQVTGSNHVWIAGAEASQLPIKVLKPTVTKARELLGADGSLEDASALRRVINLPDDLDELDDEDRAAVNRFLKWAKTQGADQSYIAQHRRPWWAVNLRSPAPIISTYMARRSPAFVRNLCSARHINVAHGLYPREHLAEPVLDSLARWLTSNVSVRSGRTYAGGLTKFEPKELERVLIPKLENLPA